MISSEAAEEGCNSLKCLPSAGETFLTADNEIAGNSIFLLRAGKHTTRKGDFWQSSSQKVEGNMIIG